jgi:hypothetical protein
LLKWTSRNTSTEFVPVKALRLSDSELDAVMNACRPLPVERRDAFLQEIVDALQRCNGEVGPGSLHRIIRETQRKHFDPPDLGGFHAAGKYR